MKAACPPLRHRPLQTVLPHACEGLEYILAVTWDRDDRADDAARVVAVTPVSSGAAPLGLALVCVAVSVGLAGGLTLAAIAEGAEWVEARFAGAGAGSGAAGGIGALARRLMAVQAGGASAAAYALDCHRPAGAETPE
jgi:hypothetical protein